MRLIWRLHTFVWHKFHRIPSHSQPPTWIHLHGFSHHSHGALCVMCASNIYCAKLFNVFVFLLCVFVFVSTLLLRFVRISSFCVQAIEDEEQISNFFVSAQNIIIYDERKWDVFAVAFECDVMLFFFIRRYRFGSAIRTITSDRQQPFFLCIL